MTLSGIKIASHILMSKGPGEALKHFYNQNERMFHILFGALLLTIFLLNLEFNWLESTLYDFRMSKGPQPLNSDDIVLIAIDDLSTTQIDQESPLSLEQHVRFLETIQNYHPKALGYLVDMNRVHQLNPESFKSGWGDRFVHVFNSFEKTGTKTLLGTPFEVLGESLPPYPLSSLDNAIAMIHKDGNVFAEDKITRRALVEFDSKPSFHIRLAKKLGAISEQSTPRGTYYEPIVDAKYFFFRYQGNSLYSPGIERKTKYPVYSWLDVMNGIVGKKALQNKIILVGTLGRDEPTDFAFTPYSKAQYANPKLVLHAHILDSIIKDNGIVRPHRIVNWLITLFVSICVMWSLFTYSPLMGVFNTFALAFIIIIIGQLLFSFGGIWIKESQPLIAIFLSYYLSVPYRLIQEYRKRWEYQKENEILLQVEELKGNFLSLVTHDLKTPIARIQGLAEVLKRQVGSKLTSDENKHITQIVSASDELNHFITSILELSKIESNEIKLHLESKDINTVIEKAVQKLSFQAQQMNITLEEDLEPQFPMQLDQSLILKVLVNLIDNALKYSPRDSKVIIRSYEKNDFIHIEVVDQGIGLTTEEINQLFTKFYRAKNDHTTKITGTGLGLYLTKYFIEAHRGKLTVESQKNHGSTFRISLPLFNVTDSITLTRGEHYV